MSKTRHLVTKHQILEIGAPVAIILKQEEIRTVWKGLMHAQIALAENTDGPPGRYRELAQKLEQFYLNFYKQKIQDPI